MTSMAGIVVGILLVAHGLVHLLFIDPNAADPRHPFSVDRSRLLPEAAGVHSPRC